MKNQKSSKKEVKLSKALLWDELADEYDKYHSNRKARTLPMDHVFEWAEKKQDKYLVSNKGTLHKIL